MRSLFKVLVLLSLVLTPALAGDRMNNGGGKNEWLLSHLRSDLLGTYTRCQANLDCASLLAQLEPTPTSVYEQLTTLRAGLEFRFEGLEAELPCADPLRALSPLSQPGQEIVRICIPALYELTREALSLEFARVVFSSITRPNPAPQALIEAWSRQSVLSTLEGSVESEVAGSPLPRLHWFAARSLNGYSDLIIATDRSGSDSLSAQFANAGLCEPEKIKATDANFGAWWLRQLTAERWVVTMPFSASCGLVRWAGEVVWELKVKSPSDFTTKAIFVRSLYRLY